MNRVIAAIVLLLLIVLGCTLSFANENTHFEDMIALADQAEQAYRNGDTEVAQQYVEKLAAHFSERSRWMSLVLPHESLTEAEKSIQGLTLILPYGEPKDFTAEARRCRLLLQRLWDQEKPTWENIL